MCVIFRIYSVPSSNMLKLTKMNSRLLENNTKVLGNDEARRKQSNEPKI